MKFENSYLAEKERVELIEDYILHEIQKMDTEKYTRAEEKITDRIGDRHAEVFTSFMNRIRGDKDSAKEALDSYDPTRKWMLFHAISYGVLYKKLFSCVGWNELSWGKASMPCSALQFESKAGFLNEMEELRPLFTDVLNFAQAKLNRTGDNGFLTAQKDIYSEAGPQTRLYDPIICRNAGSHYLIHDGTGRMLSFVGEIVLNRVDKNTEITAWRGEPVKGSIWERRIYRAAQKELFAMRKEAKMVPPHARPKPVAKRLDDAIIRRKRSLQGRIHNR